MSVKLAEVIAVLDAAYPPSLAQSWDSVGLVCGDPDDAIDSVTVAVDATADVAATVGPRGLLLAHHPLLLRGVDTVAASTPKGALIHQLIKAGAALFTAHTNADSANPGVSDALAEVLGLTVDGVLDPISAGGDIDKWVVFVPAADAETVRSALFAAGAGHIGDYSHCSWSVAGTGQFLPLEGGTGHRNGRLGGAGRRRPHRGGGPGPAAGPGARRDARRPSLRRTGVRRALAGRAAVGRRDRADRHPGRTGAVRRLRRPGSHGPAADDVGVRAAGDPDAPVSRVAVCGGAGDSLLGAAAAAGVDVYLTADLRHHPADEHRRASDVALVDVAHWASEYPWCAQAAALLRAHFGAALPVSVCDLRTDPWNIESVKGMS